MSRKTAVAIAAAALLAVPASASANTAFIENDGTLSETVVYQDTSFNFNGAQLTEDWDPVDREFVFEDAVEPITAGAGCVQEASNRVSCPVPPDFARARIVLGVGFDKATVEDTDETEVSTFGDDDGDVLTASAGGTFFDGGPHGDIINGGATADTIIGGGSADQLHGHGGDDDISGNDQKDKLFGGPGTDRLDGGADDDVFEGGTGPDTYIGGTGLDTADYSARTVGVVVDVTSPLGDGEPGEADDVRDDIEVLLGTAHDDDLALGNGGGAFHRIEAGDGDDVLTSRDHADTLLAGPGDDELFGGSNADQLTGGPGADHLDGGPNSGVTPVAPDVANYPEDVRHVVSLDGVANDGPDADNDGVADPGEVDAALVGIEAVVGGPQDDTISGSAADERLNGGGGDDRIESRGGLDAINGGADDDHIVEAPGRQSIDGASGRDTLDYSARTTGVVVRTGGVGSPEDSLINSEVVLGGSGNDTILADGTMDEVHAGGGDDTIDGGFGTARDVLDGDGGVDTASYASRGDRIRADLDGADDDGSMTFPENDRLEEIENLRGGGERDVLTGDGAPNRIEGGLGDDVLDGGLGADVLLGDDGVDAADYSARTVALNLSLDGVANDGASGEGDNVAAEELVGGSKDDQMLGDGGVNRLRGMGGNDTLDGALGTDLLDGGAGVNRASYRSRSTGVKVTLDGVDNDGDLGGGENDALLSIANIYGSEGPDVLVGDDGPNRIDAFGGADLIDGKLGPDTLAGGAAVDTVTYASRATGVTVRLNDVADDGNSSDAGSSGRDDVRSSVENVTGTAGIDVLEGSAVANELKGGGADDKLTGLAGPDKLRGEAGRDTANYGERSASQPVTVDPADGVANDGGAIDGPVGARDLVEAEDIRGSLGDDTLYGSENTANKLEGFAGNDRLFGRSGADSLLAGSGNDLLDPGTGTDTGDGASGVDTQSYRNRGTAVSISLDGVANDGGPGENDGIVNVENAEGGAGGDTITGNAGPNELWGYGGNDSLFARDGTSVVDRLHCGSGTDEYATDPSDVFDGCETFLPPAGSA